MMMPKILHASLPMFLWLHVVALFALVSPTLVVGSNNSYNGSSNSVHYTPSNSHNILRGGSMSSLPDPTFGPPGVMIRLQRKNDQQLLLGEIMVGTPPKKHLVNFDTGSSTLWLFGTNAKTALRMAAELASPSATSDREYKHTYYSRSGSTTSKPVYVNSNSGEKQLAPPFQLGYDDGDQFTGLYIGDTLQLGNNIKIQNVAIGVAQRLKSITGITTYDGVFGLGLFPPEDCDLTPPMAQTMAALEHFSEEEEEEYEQLFSVYFSVYRLDGELLLGGIDYNRFTGDITYAPLLLLPYEEETCWWTVGMDSVKYEDKMIDSATRACVDTGTSLVVAPPHLFEPLLYEISFHLKLDLYLSGDECFFLNGPCSFHHRRLKNLPGLDFKINGQVYSLPAQFYFETMRDGMCVLRVSPSEAVSESGAEEDTWLLGAPFLEAFYTVYDYGNKRVGFAEAKHPKKKKATPGGKSCGPSGCLLLS